MPIEPVIYLALDGLVGVGVVSILAALMLEPPNPWIKIALTIVLVASIVSIIAIIAKFAN